MTWWQWVLIVLVVVCAWVAMETCATGPEEWIERERRKVKR